MTSARILDEALIAKLKTLQIRTRRMVTEAFSGEYRSAFKGRGLEFEEVREYQPGDDIRAIDWNVTARTGRPFIKTYRDEREMTVLFAVDMSGSTRFGTKQQLKYELAAEITALLAYTAMKSSDKVSLLIFSDQVELYLPPKKGRAHIWRIIREILSFEPAGRGTDITVPVEFLNRVVPRHAVAFMISDFQLGQDYQKPLRAFAERHDLVAIQIQDRRELELPAIGYIALEDAETREQVLLDTSRPAVRAAIAAANHAAQQEIVQFLRSAGIAQLRVNTYEPYIDDLMRFFRNRELR